jgi:hypothetical protein
MSLFYFHLRSGADLIADQEGSEWPDLESARREASVAARHILAEAIKFSAENIPEAFVITDGEGREVATLPFASVLPKQLQPRVGLALSARSQNPEGHGVQYRNDVKLAFGPG